MLSIAGAGRHKLRLIAAAPMVMFAAILAFCAAGTGADLIVRRRIHPAYLWGQARSR